VVKSTRADRVSAETVATPTTPWQTETH
jgi:hypothetical protein